MIVMAFSSTPPTRENAGRNVGIASANPHTSSKIPVLAKTLFQFRSKGKEILQFIITEVITKRNIISAMVKLCGF